MNEATPDNIKSFDELLAQAHAAELTPEPDSQPVEEDDASVAEVEAEAADEAPVADGDVEAEAEVAETTEADVEARPLEETSDFKRLGKKAQARIQELVSERKEQQAAADALAAERQRYAQHIERMRYEQQLRDQQAQFQLQQYQAELAEIRKAREDAALEEKFKADPVAKFKHELLREADSIAEQKAAAKVAVIQQQLQKQAQERDAELKQRERQARFSKWEGQLKEAIPANFFQGVEDKASVARLAPALENFLLAYAASGAEEPAGAVKEFKKVIDDLVALQSKAKAKATGAVLAKNKGLPASGNARSVVNSSINDVSVPKPPPKGVLMQHGYSNAREWYKDGSPVLK